MTTTTTPTTTTPTTTTPTTATLRATLTAAEQRLVAANDEMEDAQEARDDAASALAAALDALDAHAAHVRPSACAGRAWDVDVTLVDTDGSVVAEGEVTLVVGERDGRPSSWGDLDHWVSHGLIGTLADHRDLARSVEAVAREAIEASGVPCSPEYEG